MLVKSAPLYNSPLRGETAAQTKASMNNVSSPTLALIKTHKVPPLRGGVVEEPFCFTDIWSLPGPGKCWDLCLGNAPVTFQNYIVAILAGKSGCLRYIAIIGLWLIRAAWHTPAPY